MFETDSHLSPLLKLLEQIMFQVSEFITSGHVQLIVALGTQQTCPQLAEHGAGVLQPVHQLALVQASLHLERLDLDYSQSFIKQFVLLVSHDCICKNFN